MSDLKTDQPGNEQSSNGDSKKQKRSPSYNPDDWKFLSRNYIKDDAEHGRVEMITEAKTVGTGVRSFVIERNTALKPGYSPSLAVVVLSGIKLQYFPGKVVDGKEGPGQWKYSVGN